MSKFRGQFNASSRVRLSFRIHVNRSITEEFSHADSLFSLVTERFVKRHDGSIVSTNLQIQLRTAAFSKDLLSMSNERRADATALAIK